MSVEHNEALCILRLEGDCTMATAGELKSLLLNGLASGKKLQVDLALAAEADITLLQLLWATAHEAAQENQRFVTGVPQAIAELARNAGFESFPGEPGEVGVTGEALESTQG